jgi:hypothetical protein
LYCCNKRNNQQKIEGGDISRDSRLYATFSNREVTVWSTSGMKSNFRKEAVIATVAIREDMVALPVMSDQEKVLKLEKEIFELKAKHEISILKS